MDTYINIDEDDKKQLEKRLQKNVQEIALLQRKLSAENRQSLLIILQGMDGSGKDSAIRHVMSGINPQDVLVYSFKKPAEQDFEHDYLWRHAQKLPKHGQITVFNRSHYEHVLISKVHPELVLTEHMPGVNSISQVNMNFWEMRYQQINQFEKSITESGTQILKCYLHLSKEEQRMRFLKRIEKKNKRWKFAAEDIAERKFWDKYERAYEAALQYTNKRNARWYIIPADNKLYAHLLISDIIIARLKEMKPALPRISREKVKQMMIAKRQLQNEQ